MKINGILILMMTVFLSSCGAPIANAAEQEPSNPFQEAKPQEAIKGENLLKAYGCPNQFEDIPLCVQIFWFNDVGKAADGPIYWQKYREHAMAAKILFWNSKDGWPIDPRVEFPEAKFIRIKLFMPSMGHGTMGHFPKVEEVKGRVGQFQISNIRFVMGCDKDDPWDFRIQLKSAHDDNDFDAADDPNVWKQKVLQFTNIERR